jgi:hypothetical protein
LARTSVNTPVSFSALRTMAYLSSVDYIESLVYPGCFAQRPCYTIVGKLGHAFCEWKAR